MVFQDLRAVGLGLFPQQAEAFFVPVARERQWPPLAGCLSDRSRHSGVALVQPCSAGCSLAKAAAIARSEPTARAAPPGPPAGYPLHGNGVFLRSQRHPRPLPAPGRALSRPVNVSSGPSRCLWPASRLRRDGKGLRPSPLSALLDGAHSATTRRAAPRRRGLRGRRGPRWSASSHGGG